jgi:GcrA cell cycle regulator
MAWTEERIAKLKQGWESGMTATQIAEMLGEGVTRNAVIGKAHRLGLESRPSPVKAGESPAPATARAAPPPAPPSPPPTVAASTAAASAAAAHAPTPAAVAQPPQPAAPSPVARPAPRPAKSGKQTRTTLLDLNEKVCKWPIGHPDDADFHFCGKPSNPGFPYCGEHCLVAYQAQMPRRDRPRQLPTVPGVPRS